MTRFRKTIHAATEAVLAVVIACAAAVWKVRAGLVDLAGGACLVVAASLVSAPAGWAVAGVWLTVQAYGIERKGKP